MSHGEYRSDRDGMIKDGMSLDTPDRRSDGRKYFSSFGSNMHDDQHHYHPYRGVTRDICWTSLRKKSHLHLMER